MEIFIDSASVSDVRKWLDIGVIDGVTTNPTIMLKDGVHDSESCVKEIAALVNPRPVCVSVTTNDLDEIITQAEKFALWAPNIVTKIPQITQDGTPCYGVIRELESEGIRINATAALSMGQVMLAAKSGATYISIFAGRVTDEGGNIAEVVKNSVWWLEHWKFKSKIIIGSIRSVGDILSTAMAGAHIITIPPQFLNKMADHKYTRDTVRQFVSDAAEALAIMDRIKSSSL